MAPCGADKATELAFSSSLTESEDLRVAPHAPMATALALHGTAGAFVAVMKTDSAAPSKAFSTAESFLRHTLVRQPSHHSQASRPWSL